MKTLEQRIAALEARFDEQDAKLAATSSGIADELRAHLSACGKALPAVIDARLTDRHRAPPAAGTPQPGGVSQPDQPQDSEGGQ